LVYGLRGLAYFELKLTGPDHDLHSGMFGGSVHNPAQVLCELIAGMHDPEGRVTLPGFYDKVRPLSMEERSEIALSPYSDKEWRGLTGAPELFGEQGYTTLERVGARPTPEVNGLTSGYSGEGQKTVLPANATAKISMRLVPDQDPQSVDDQLRAFFREHTPTTVRWELKTLAVTPPVRMRRDGPGMSAAARSLREAFGKAPVFVLEGGSIPAVSILGGTLGVDSVLMGFSLPDDNIHSPNERFYLPNLSRGVEAYIRFFNHLAALGVA
jgi:acetylornithine deacetylase/succinyl-diaminopimelate desuccinylase-like protein